MAKAGPVDYLSVVLVTVTVTFVVWLFPMLLGKYADLTYPYIPGEDIFSELVTLSPPTNTSSPQQKPLCPLHSPLLKGLQLEVALDNQWSQQHVTSFAKKMGIENGGVWQPSHCTPTLSATVIVGVKDRDEQLHQFLLYMHSFLSRQLLRYRIVVVEQMNRKPFNRGKAFNIGFTESLKLPNLRGEEHCFIFHDVDLLPLHDHNMYACTKQPRHMSVAVDTFRYQLPYRSLCGGSIAIQTHQFKELNGFSNKFEGWGGEDDDFCYRIQEGGLNLVRFDPRVAVYSMLPHPLGTPSPGRFHTLQEAALSAHSDGLSGLQFTATSEPHPLMLHLSVRW